MERKSEIETYILWNYVDERFVENVDVNFVEFVQMSRYNGIHNKIIVEPVTLWEDRCRGIPVRSLRLCPVFSQ